MLLYVDDRLRDDDKNELGHRAQPTPIQVQTVSPIESLEEQEEEDNDDLVLTLEVNIGHRRRVRIYPITVDGRIPLDLACLHTLAVFSKLLI